MAAKKRLVMLVKRGPKARAFPFAPSYKGDVGFNLVTTKTTTIPPGASIAPTDVPVDIAVKLPPGTWARIEPRSSMYGDYPGLVLCSSPVDNGYTGSLNPRFRNHTRNPITVRAGVALVQLVLYPIIVPDVEDVDVLPVTERGGKRYGSSTRKKAKRHAEPRKKLAKR